MNSIEDVAAVQFVQRAKAAIEAGTAGTVLPELDMQLLHIAMYPCPKETYLAIIATLTDYPEHNFMSRNLAVISLVHQQQSYIMLLWIYDNCVDAKVKETIAVHLISLARTQSEMAAILTRLDPSSRYYHIGSGILPLLQ